MRQSIGEPISSETLTTTVTVGASPETPVSGSGKVSLNCSDAEVLYRNPIFWLEKNLEVVLSLGVILMHVFLFYLLRKDEKLPRALRWLLLLNSVLSSSLGTYLLAKSVYTFLAFLLSECPLLSTIRSCRIQETYVLFTYAFFAFCPLMMGLERVFSHLHALRHSTASPNETTSLTSSDSKNPLRGFFGSVTVTLFSITLPTALIAGVYSLEEERRDAGVDRILLLQCNILSTLPAPLPLCCCITLAIICLLTALVWSWAISVSKQEGIRECGNQARRFFFDARVTQELVTTIVAQAMVIGISMILSSIIYLIWRLAKPGNVVIRILAEEFAFYLLPITNSFLFAVTVSWKLSPVRTILLRIFPCLKGMNGTPPDISSPKVEVVPQSSIHSLPDNLSLSEGDEMTLVVTESCNAIDATQLIREDPQDTAEHPSTSHIQDQKL